MKENHILPFLWMRGESEDILRTELKKIREAGIRSVCLEARPHPDYAGEGWWHDVDIVIDEAKKHDMQIWILDDAHFPTGMANGSMAAHPDKAISDIPMQMYGLMDGKGTLARAEELMKKGK